MTISDIAGSLAPEMTLQMTASGTTGRGALSRIGAGIGTGTEESGVSSTGGTFENALLEALDGVSATQNFSSALAQQAIIDPDSVDTHDVTIAQAEASLALNITRNVLNRLVQGWKDIINTR